MDFALYEFLLIPRQHFEESNDEMIIQDIYLSVNAAEAFLWNKNPLFIGQIKI